MCIVHQKWRSYANINVGGLFKCEKEMCARRVVDTGYHVEWPARFPDLTPTGVNNEGQIDYTIAQRNFA